MGVLLIVLASSRHPRLSVFCKLYSHQVLFSKVVKTYKFELDVGQAEPQHGTGSPRIQSGQLDLSSEGKSIYLLIVINSFHFDRGRV